MSVICIIPARSGSKGVKNKNLRNLNGFPLIYWTIKRAIESKSFKRILVSTDSDEIAKVAIKYGAEVPELRPYELAQDATPTEPVIEHALLNWCNNDFVEYVVILQPTSPLRTAESISNGIKQIISENADSLLTVKKISPFLWKKNPNKPLYDTNNRLRRQDFLEGDLIYQETGSIYITKLRNFLANKNRLSGKISLLITNENESVDIDCESDLNIAEAIMCNEIS